MTVLSMNPGRSWTKAEIETLRGMAEASSNVCEIARALGRTNEAVKARARALGLRINSVIGRPGR